MIRAGIPTFSSIWNGSYLQPVRFTLVGGLATVSHWLVMALAINLGAMPAMATAIGAVIGALVNYILQRNVTFQSNNSHRTALRRYLIVCLLIWGANLFIFFTLYHIVLLATVYAQLLTTLLVAFMSYFLYKRTVFL